MTSIPICFSFAVKFLIAPVMYYNYCWEVYLNPPKGNGSLILLFLHPPPHPSKENPLKIEASRDVAACPKI